jgi:hypothetical protein
MNELILLEIAKKIGIVILQIVGVLLFVAGFIFWMTGGHISFRPEQKKIHDTIYLPQYNQNQ